MKTKIKRLAVSLLFLMIAGNALSQIHSARIVFERKTNLYKKFAKERDVTNWIKEEDKIKIDNFELFVSDSISLFRPQESELRENLSWATSKNTVYQDFRKGNRYMIKPMWGEELHVTDTLYRRNWKISNSTRKIAGYTCRKASWDANDSTRIYAWFSYDLVPSTGPESFYGLPGTILGLATENGGVVYFAKTVELMSPPPATFQVPKKKKVYTLKELIADLTKQYGHEKWFKREYEENFGIW